MDREDIHELVCRIDDIIDLIDTCVNRMLVYRIRSITPEALELARCLRHATLVIVETVPLLRDMKNSRRIAEKCIAINTQENEADRLLQAALTALFKDPGDPLEVITWKDLYEKIEAATDRCEDVANVLDTIVLKHA
jgi:uncharacterized protein Yka (UPF0111/DUF47 family)